MRARLLTGRVAKITLSAHATRGRDFLFRFEFNSVQPAGIFRMSPGGIFRNCCFFSNAFCRSLRFWRRSYPSVQPGLLCLLQLLVLPS